MTFLYSIRRDMDDHLEEFREQIRQERERAAEARAAREKERLREAEYQAAWGAMVAECCRLQDAKERKPDIAAFQQLVAMLASRQQLEWLFDMRDNFVSQLKQGLDNPTRSRRAEVWLLDSLIALTEDPPNVSKAAILVREVTSFSPFGFGSVAGDVSEYFKIRVHQVEQPTATTSPVQEVVEPQPAADSPVSSGSEETSASETVKRPKRGRPSTIDRDLAILADYESGLVTLDKLAEKHGFSDHTGALRACDRARRHREKGEKM